MAAVGAPFDGQAGRAGGTAAPAPAPARTGSPQLSLEQSLLEQGDGRLDDYTVEKAIGRGHFSVVHRAIRKSDGRKVALKKVQIFDMMDAKTRDRCLKEVKLLQTLEPHPCIIQYLDSFITDNELYIVFEFAEHGDLRRLLRRALECNATLQEPQIWRYFTQVCSGISHMHAARVMHRDIKPANIFLAANGCVKLGDLGLGRAFSDQTYEAISKVGTPLYMSPEVLDGRGYEWKSDIWSLGCLLYELATLRSPFKGQGDKDNLYSLFKKISGGQFAQLPDHYSEHLRSLVGRMIQTDPHRRPDIAETLKAAMEATADFAAQAEAQARGDAAGSGPVDCVVLMDTVLDKLKILDYEALLLRPRHMPPLPRGYFTSATMWPLPEQFRYLYRLVCWLVELGPLPSHDLWERLPAHPSDAEIAAAAAALVAALGGCGGAVGQVAAALPPMKLRSAHGEDVCGMLNVLADAALAARGFGWGKPSHGEVEPDGVVEEQSYAEEPEVVCGSGRTRSHGEGGDQAVEEAEACERVVDSVRLLPLLESGIDSAAWQLECDRCTPLLKVKLSWRQLHWRHRLELAGKRAPEMAEAFGEAAPGLDAYGTRAGHEAAALAPLLRKQSELDAEAGQRESDGAAAQARVDSLAAQLRRLGEEVDQTRREVDELADRIGDRRGVGAVAAACRQLRGETAQVAMRTALAQRELTRHRWREKRRGGAGAGSAGGGDAGAEEESWEGG